MNFRSDINGLRAIAVAAVVLFHFGVFGFDGGFVGVDVFFVISGFLMTGIIFGKLERTRFSLLAFYLDRARRIIPALAVLCVCLMLFGWFVLPPSQYAALGKHAASAVSFTSNHVFSGEAGYFEAAAHEKWLLHTWSLSVEWQFYLLYPIVIIVAAKFMPLVRVRWLIVLGTGASFVLSVYWSSRWPSISFFLLPTRAWEMLAGALVFLFPIAWRGRSARIAEVAGLATILISVLAFSEVDVWPGWLASIPVLGSALVIASAQSKSPFTNNPLSQFLGKISYSVYLWHWPLVVGLYYFDKNKELPWITTGIALSVLLGYFSFSTVESRLRDTEAKRPDRARPSFDGKMWGKVAVIAATVLVPGIVLLKSGGVPGATRAINSDEKVVFLAKYEDMLQNGLHEDYRHECDFYDWRTKASRLRIDPACTNIDGQAKIFIWGDSHAQALSKGVSQLYPGVVVQVATSACPPSLRPRGRSGLDNNCDGSNAYAVAQITRLKPTIVLMAQAEHHEKTDWDLIARRLRELGVKKVVLVGPMPNWRPSLPVIVARRHWQDNVQYLSDGLDPAPVTTDMQLKAAYGKSSRLEYISLIEKLCGGLGCRASLPRDQMLLVVDYGHLSPSGSLFVASTILAEPLNTMLDRVQGGELLHAAQASAGILTRP